MELKVKSLAWAMGLVWGGGMLVIGLAATATGSSDGYYGKDFMLVMASVYPGYDGVMGYGDALVGGIYGFVDGAIGGGLLAWLYNRCAAKCGGQSG